MHVGFPGQTLTREGWKLRVCDLQSQEISLGHLRFTQSHLKNNSISKLILPAGETLLY